MASGHDTIVALSSGQGRAAIALVRVSGSLTRFVIETILSQPLVPRMARLVAVTEPVSGQVLDHCVATFFAAPRSATGEDVVELGLHGGLAVVEAVLRCICEIHPDIRLAEPGEFSRRALENGKLSLVQVEALGDLLEAETRQQLAQAQRQLSGELHDMAGLWRERLTRMRALIEAELDFSDEGDVADGQLATVQGLAGALENDIRAVLGTAERGRLIRDGAVIAIMGAPNAGKSMLLNALVGRDMAIVSDIPGTTRDLIEAPAVIEGWPVVFVDTAGLRQSLDPVERLGIERARAMTERADVVLLVSAPDVPPVGQEELIGGAKIIQVRTKRDIDLSSVDPGNTAIRVSALSGAGLDQLRDAIGGRLRMLLSGEPSLVSRERQRKALSEAVYTLARSRQQKAGELLAEDLRSASQALARLVGATDLDTVLDRLFAGFCIGK
ncbi:MAG: tRNA uridine-5-carboxymethylaminomethyl(34) synthesis GTPase MnmE [Bosea sp. (in: a-proteobacteria)]